MRALIAIPAYPRLEEGRVQKWHDAGIAIPARYVDALRAAGGTEAIFSPSPMDDTEADALLERVDGVLLLGGGDVDPAAYGAEPGDTVYAVSTERDACELALTRAAIRTGVPLLAICRGHQVLNVATGGELDQHITGRADLGEHGKPGVAGGGALHDVTIAADSRLGAAMGTTRATCSCHHHQAVSRLGDGLRVVAEADDGVIEGLELADASGPWVVGVQWHPEDTAAEDPAQHSLFESFVAEAARRR